jgi:hypothetical protein
MELYIRRSSLAAAAESDKGEPRASGDYEKATSATRV